MRIPRSAALLAIFSLLIADCAFGANIVFIGLGDPSPDGDDQPVITFLASLGHNVTYGTCNNGNEAPESVASGADLIIASSTCNSGDLRADMTWLHTSSLGVLTWESAYTDGTASNLGMHTSDNGYVGTAVEVLADSAQHAATASLGPILPGQTVALFSSDLNMREYYGLAPDVRGLAGAPTTGRYVVIVAEIDGRLLNAMLAPGRRAVFSGGTNTFFPSTNAAGKQVFGDLVAWTADINDRPYVSENVTLPSMLHNDSSTPITVAKITELANWRDADDANYTVFSGIAVVGTRTVGGGYWQWSANGNTWSNVSAVSDTDALHLAAWNNESAIRFIPQSGIAGAGALSFRGWDRSNSDPTKCGTGSRGDTVSTRSRGETPYSADIMYVKIDILDLGPSTTSSPSISVTTAVPGVSEPTSIPSGSGTMATSGTSSVSLGTGTSSTFEGVINASESSNCDFLCEYFWYLIVGLAVLFVCVLVAVVAYVKSRQAARRARDASNVDWALEDARLDCIPVVETARNAIAAGMDSDIKITAVTVFGKLGEARLDKYSPGGSGVTRLCELIMWTDGERAHDGSFELLIDALAASTDPSDLDMLAAALVGICTAHADLNEGAGALPIVRVLIEHEAAASASETGTAFRGNSLAIKAFGVFAKATSLPWLANLLCETLESIYSSDSQTATLEIASVDESARVMLESYCQAILDALMTLGIPPAIGAVLATLRLSAAEHFDEDIASNLVASFMFLRLIGPAIVAPQEYCLNGKKPSSDISKVLISVSKVLQALCTNMDLTKKDGKLAIMSSFIVRNRATVLNYLSATVQATALTEITASDSICISPKELQGVGHNSVAFLHSLLNRQVSDLQLDDELQRDLRECLSKLGKPPR